LLVYRLRFHYFFFLVTKIPEQKSTSTNIQTNREHVEKVHTHQLPPSKPSTREVAMQHIVEDEKPPPLPPKQRQQRDVAISHTTEYDDDDEKQTEIVRRKLEEIKNFYTERIHFLEGRILEQEKDIDRLSEPKKQRHVNTQCQPTMQDRALVTDTFRSGK
jgi:DNA-dependent RNA polymerase auxiliary subunit epsilon